MELIPGMQGWLDFQNSINVFQSYGLNVLCQKIHIET
jgi:hypothetical protein